MLKKLHVRNVTVFSDATFTFGDLNVIHGENSSGKTHLLKLAYSLVSSLVPSPNEPTSERPTRAALDPRIGAKLVGVFRPDRGKLGRLARRIQGQTRAEVRADLGPVGVVEFSFSTQSDRAVRAEAVPATWLEQAPVFLGTRELLSVYPGFVSLYETQAIPFDEAWRDTCLLLGAPIARGPKKKEIAALLGPLEEALGCKAILEGDRFFIQMTHPNAKVEADLVAEGYRKLTMVARLIATGSLDERGMLFWDEPEANLNPALIRRLAPLLLDLAAGGVQVFVATHSLFLMRELDIELSRRKRKPKTRYFGLHPSESGVQVHQGNSIDESGDIAALEESLSQSDRYLGVHG
jgi:energy-coupling factor transporter ATP-binding protein EcfA2